MATAILGFLYCKAQQPIFNVFDYTIDYGNVENAHYKDTENFRDQFVGTWIYTNGNTTLKVVFQKKDMVYFSPPPVGFYSDFLIGEFQYIENGVEKVNTLNNLNINYTDIWSYNIIGNSKIISTHEPSCEDCPSDAVRLRMSFDEPANDDATLNADFVIRHVIENGVEKLKVQFVFRCGAVGWKKGDLDTPSTATEHTIPYGYYTLIKQ